jgi:hypothetical protein
MAAGSLRPVKFGAAFVVSALALASCGKSTSGASAFEDARADLQSRSTYHLSAVVKAPPPLASPLDGTYEIDFEKPNRYRTVRMVGSKEASRTVAIGTDLFGSDDQGASWQHAAVGAEGAFSARTLLELLDTVCAVKGDGSRLHLDVASRKQACAKPLSMSIELKGDVIHRIETEMPTDLGSLSVAAQFDFDRAVEPIVKPAETTP